MGLFGASSSSTEHAFEAARLQMVRDQIERRGVTDSRVLDAMRTIPRHLFVPDEWQSSAYEDNPLPIPCGQTISQPYIVASMTELLAISSSSRILEIGTGSGYQTAVLASLAKAVYSIEIHSELQESARRRLAQLRYCNITFRCGDGSLGWPEEAPFDGIIVTAAADAIAPELSRQLAEGGSLVIPVRENRRGDQVLMLVRKAGSSVTCRPLYPVRFVPLLHPPRADF